MKFLDVKTIEAGAIAVLGNMGEAVGIVTVDHINSQGNWVVAGDWAGALCPTMRLCTLVVRDEDGKEYPLKFNQWKKSIKAGEVNTDKVVTFKLKPAKFVPGHYMKECSICTSQFLAHKRQPVCEECCNKNVSAQIILTKKEPKQATKVKRKRMMNPSTTKLIALEAYKKGVNGVSYKDMEKWLDKTLK
jgi:hypothetical protein